MNDALLDAAYRGDCDAEEEEWPHSFALFPEDAQPSGGVWSLPSRVSDITEEEWTNIRRAWIIDEDGDSFPDRDIYQPTRIEKALICAVVAAWAFRFVWHLI